MKVQTQAVHFNADKKLKEFIEKKINRLEQFSTKLLRADVFLKLENSGRIKDKIAEIKLHLPGTVLYVKESQKTFEASVDSAIDALKRQLIRYKERRRQRA